MREIQTEIDRERRRNESVKGRERRVRDTDRERGEGVS